MSSNANVYIHQRLPPLEPVVMIQPSLINCNSTRGSLMDNDINDRHYDRETD